MTNVRERLKLWIHAFLFGNCTRSCGKTIPAKCINALEWCHLGITSISLVQPMIDGCSVGITKRRAIRLFHHVLPLSQVILSKVFVDDRLRGRYICNVFSQPMYKDDACNNIHYFRKLERIQHAGLSSILKVIATEISRTLIILIHDIAKVYSRMMEL